MKKEFTLMKSLLVYLCSQIDQAISLLRYLFFLHSLSTLDPVGLFLNGIALRKFDCPTYALFDRDFSFVKHFN